MKEFLPTRLQKKVEKVLYGWTSRKKWWKPAKSLEGKRERRASKKRRGEKK